ncbi:MAG: hypothetical protein Q8P41_05355 [Pseudomonadota bacterium]|nr:hypothetical protein [Pseudomonadota bacterium]
MGRLRDGLALLALPLLTACGLSKMLPGPPALSPRERAAFDVPAPSGARYTGGPRVDFPVLPLQVWGLRYGLDVVLVSTHPDWDMHEYARVDLPSGPLWLAKDADADGNQGIVADLPDIEAWIPEVPAPRVAGPLVVTDKSTAEMADLHFAYTNPAGEPVEVSYRGRIPTEPSKPRNGNTMGHSRAAVAALLDLHLFRTGGEASIRIGGKEWPLKRLLGLVPLKILLAQTQGGFAIADFRVTPAADGGFTLVRPGSAVPWPTAATEAWTVVDGWARRDGPIVSLRYHFRDGELDRAQVWQVGVDVPITDVVFHPALPDLRRPFEGTVDSAFAVDIAGQAGHGTGRIRAAWTGPDTVSVQMIPTEPRWFADRPMETTLRYEADGVAVKVGRTAH